MDASIGIATPQAAPRADAVSMRVQAPAKPSDAGGQPADRSPTAQGIVDDRLSSRREIVEDRDTNSMVYRVVDVATGEVASQTPSEARLKLRAYIDRIVAKNQTKPSFEQTA